MPSLGSAEASAGGSAEASAGGSAEASAGGVGGSLRGQVGGGLRGGSAPSEGPPPAATVPTHHARRE